MPLQNTIIVVNEEPYCVWEVDLKQRNREFLEGIDVDYFEYQLNIHANADDEMRASIALRSVLHHAVETFFSLLGAYIQAPDCVYAWVAKCSNKELRALVGKIVLKDPSTFTKLGLLKEVSFESVSDSIFRYYMPNSEKGAATKKLFAELWGRMALEFLNNDNIDEYNSLKHGFRVRSGGFALAAGIEHEYGVPPPEEEMRFVGASEFGTSFVRIEGIGDAKNNRSLRSRKVSLNWRVEAIALQLQLVCASITNVVSALKIANAYKASECKFVRPTEDDDFVKPWLYSTGVSRLIMDFVIDEGQVVSVTKNELLELLRTYEEE